MPRKRIVKKENDEIKPSIEDALANRNDNIIARLPLTDKLIKEVIDVKNKHDEPKAFEPDNVFKHEQEIITDNNNLNRSVCFWCCYPITNFSCGMPIAYNAKTDHFQTYGTFCSFQCANAHNFSINSKSIKAWNINNLINQMAKKYGFTNQIRTAPSRYLTEMFGNTMTIEEFRASSNNGDKTFVENIPPMSCVSVSIERLNTSYIQK